MIKSTGYTTARGGSDLGIGISGICNGVLMLMEGIGHVGYFDVDLVVAICRSRDDKVISWMCADTHIVPIPLARIWDLLYVLSIDC